MRRLMMTDKHTPYRFYDQVFKGEDGLKMWAEKDEFWQKQDYGTRFYFGDGINEYVHRDVLRAAIEHIDCPITQEAVNNHERLKAENERLRETIREILQHEEGLKNE
jgi:hypothetical protein